MVVYLGNAWQSRDREGVLEGPRSNAAITRNCFALLAAATLIGGVLVVLVAAATQQGTFAVARAAANDSSPTATAHLPCTSENDPANFTFYSVGAEFEGLTVTHDMRVCYEPSAGEFIKPNYVSYIYSDCGLIPELQPPGAFIDCPNVLEIQTWPTCERSLADYELDPGVPLPQEPLGMRRGVPAFAFDAGNRVELFTGSSTVVIFAAEPHRIASVVAALRPAPPATPPASPVAHTGAAIGDLPAPSLGAMTGSLSCSA